MTGRDRILTALKRETPDRVPTFEWFIDESVGDELTGSRDPVDIVERLDIDGINIRADYANDHVYNSTFVDEWGVKRKMTGDCIPAVVESPIKDIRSHTEYTFPEPAASNRLASYENARERFGDKRALILNLRDGWSDMRDLLGYEECLVTLLTEPEHFAALLARVVDYNIAVAKAAVDRFGADIVATTDDVATADGLLVPPNTYFDVIGPAFKKVTAGYKDLGCYCIKHCDGNIEPLIEFWIEAGIDCIDPVDPGAGMEMGEFNAKYGDRICLKGNVDCVGTLCTGSEQEVEDEVKRCVEKGGKAGLILSSSNTIHRGVKPNNYAAMLRALRQYG